MIQYCINCVLPETKPDLLFDDEGMCSACINYYKRKNIDWLFRQAELKKILSEYRSRNGNWDCVIPVSGGKDSTYQVVRMLELGMNPLCVTATTCDLTCIGKKNIENIKNLGVDYIEFSPNKEVRRQLNRIGLTEVGDISWPEHVAIFTIPVRVATQYKIPLIVWGENPQNEYGGPASSSKKNILDRAWLEEFGGLLGLRVSDLASTYGIAQKILRPYMYPSDEELKSVGVTGLFIGYYLPWDGFSNMLIAQANGMTLYDKVVEGSIVNYENLDNYQTGIHDYFKFLKFGFGRSADIASLHIRRGRLAREDAIKLVTMHDGKFPWRYLGKDLKDILGDIEVTVDEFTQICDQFTNKKLFKLDKNGTLLKDKNGNLNKINYDNNAHTRTTILDEVI